MVKAEVPKRRTEYLPPSDDAIYNYARNICDQLANDGDIACTHLEVVHGLAEFMQLAARIQAKYLNRVQAVDNRDKSEYS